MRGDRTRKRVLDQAVAIAATDGIEGLTFGKVAAAAHVPKSTLQVVFKDRQGLQLQTLSAGAEIFANGIRARLKPDPTAFGRLRGLCEAWFDQVAQTGLPGGCLVTAAAVEYRGKQGAIRASIDTYRQRWRDHLHLAAQAARDAGELRVDVDLQQLVFEIMALQAAANISLGERSAPDFTRARRAMESLLRRAQPDTAGGLKKRKTTK